MASSERDGDSATGDLLSDIEKRCAVGDVAEAEAAIQRFAPVLADEGLVVREV